MAFEELCVPWWVMMLGKTTIEKGWIVELDLGLKLQRC